MSREDSNYMEDRIASHYASTRNRSPDTSACCVLVSELPRKTTQSSTEWSNAFTHVWKRQNKISSNSVLWSPMASGSPNSQCRTNGLTPPPTPNPPPWWRLKYWMLGAGLRASEALISAGGQRSTHWAHTKEPETGIYLPTQGDKINTGCVDSLPW